MKRLFVLLLLLGACGDCSDDNKNQNNTNNENNIRPERDGGLNNGNNGNNGMDVSFLDIATPDVGSCSPGEAIGCVNDTTQLVCDNDGDGAGAVACPDGDWCLFGECGDQRCVPDAQGCVDPATVGTCNADGTDFATTEPCPTGTVCEDSTCKTICDLGAKSFSYIGCEYWTVDLDQYTDPSTNPKPDEVPHAIVISNPGPADATISFNTQDPLVVVDAPDPVVPVGEARSFTIPRRDVSGTGISFNAVQVLSTSPVIAHQFNPLNNSNVFSNDASLLLPASENGTDYYVIGWPTGVIQCIPQLPCFAPQHGYVTIVATSGAAEVTVTSTTEIRPAANNSIPGMTAGQTSTFTVNAGQVLNLEAGSMTTGVYDLTGTRITSTAPIAVFSGHEEAVIGEDRGNDGGGCCADHLEQQLFPVNTWGSRYVAPMSPDRGNNNDVWRILSAENGNTITTDPPQPGANGVTLGAGQWIEFESSESFLVTGTGKLSVGQFLVSQDHTDQGTGDPAFTLLPAIEQYREDYHLLTPTGYNQDFVLILRPVGATVNLDGAPVAAPFVAVGASGYERAVVTVQPGVHQLDGSEPFGIIAYGFDNAVSYAYPGGLNLVGLDE